MRDIRYANDILIMILWVYRLNKNSYEIIDQIFEEGKEGLRTTCELTAPLAHP